MTTDYLAIAAAFGSAELVAKVLGPTAEYLGGGMKSWAEKRANNVGRIISIAEKKLGDRIEQNESVPPKVLKTILNDGSFSDDSLAAEYFGGVLASSRSGVSRDDRGASMAVLVARLSTYQLRAHFIFYKIIKELFDGSSYNLASEEDRRKVEVFIPDYVFSEAMSFSNDEQVGVILVHIMNGLVKEDLIHEQFTTGSLEFIREFYKEAKYGGITFKPSSLGIELFLWVHAQPNLLVNDFLNPEITFRSEIEIHIPAGYCKTNGLVVSHDIQNSDTIKTGYPAY